MIKNKLRSALTAALPVREVRQPGVSVPSYPDVYAADTVSARQSSDSPRASSAAVSVLQATLKQASEAVTLSNAQLNNLQALQLQMLEGTKQNTQALNQNTQAKSSGPGALATAGNIASGMLNPGGLLAPLVSGLVSLFGSGNRSSQPAFTAFNMPSAVHVQTTLNSGAAPPSPPATSGNPTATAPAVQAPSSQIQVNVNAMDSRSFIDHSDDIAEAVRRALLNSHALGDVITGL